MAEVDQRAETYLADYQSKLAQFNKEFGPFRGDLNKETNEFEKTDVFHGWTEGHKIWQSDLLPEQRDRHEEMEARIKELFPEIDRFRNAFNRPTEELFAIHARKKAHADVVKEIRPMGGMINGRPSRNVKPKRYGQETGGLSTQQIVDKTSEFYPTDWIELSSARGKIDFRRSPNGRAHYGDINLNGNSEIKLDNSIGTGVHEVGHRMEYSVPGLYQLEALFWERRTEGEELRTLRSITKSRRYGANEMAKEDEFFRPYAGKYYSDGEAFEIFTMGWEHMYEGDPKVDDDYRSFMYGAVATIGRDRPEMTPEIAGSVIGRRIKSAHDSASFHLQKFVMRCWSGRNCSEDKSR